MTYSYERLINLMKDANLQVENMIALGFYDPVFQTAILLSRRVSILSALTTILTWFTLLTRVHS